MASASPSATPEPRVLVQFGAAHGGDHVLFPDKTVELRVLQQAGAAFAVRALFNALKIPQDKHDRYDVQDLDARSLSGAQLAAMTDSNFLIRVVRSRKRPVSDGGGDAQTPAHGRGSAGAAGGASAGGASASARASGGGSAPRAAKAPRLADEDDMEEGVAVDGFSNRRWQCNPSFNVLDQCAPGPPTQAACMHAKLSTLTDECPVHRSLGSDFSLVNALLEMIDNAIRALLMRRGAALREVHVSCLRGPTGSWCLLVRDTGVGMPASRFHEWAILGVHDGTHRPVDDVNPCFPDGNLHYWGVGGKCAALRIVRENGRISVVSRSPAEGVTDDVCVMYLSKAVCRQRQAAADAHTKAQAALPAHERAVAGPLPPSAFELPGEIRPPTSEELGLVEAFGGGRWDGGGTLCRMDDIDEAAVARWGPQAGMEALQRIVKMTYHKYVHNNEAQHDFPPPPLHGERGAGGGSYAAAAAAAETAASRKRKASAADKGKGRASGSGADAPAHAPPVPHNAPVRIIVGGRDLAEVTDDLMTRMLFAGRTGEGECFELALAVTFENKPLQLSQARIRLMYNPFVNGAPTKPSDLAEAFGVLPGHILKHRCGRLLQNDGKPATLRVAALKLRYRGDTGAMETAAKALGERALERITGFLHMGWTWEPLKNKADLRPDVPLSQVLSALFSEDLSEEELGAKMRTEHGLATAHMSLVYEDAAGSHNIPWLAFKRHTFRSALLSWAAHCHEEYDREAAPFAPAGEYPTVIAEAAPGDRAALGIPEGERLTVWSGMSVAFDAPTRAGAAGGSSVAAAPMRKELHTSTHKPLRLKLTPRSTVTHSRGPGKTRAELWSIAFFVTKGDPEDTSMQADTALAVLDHWAAPPAARALLHRITDVPLTLGKEPAHAGKIDLRCVRAPRRFTCHAVIIPVCCARARADACALLRSAPL
jgi:hypothetical protein